MNVLLTDKQLQKYGARLRGQRLWPFLQSWQLKRALRKLASDGRDAALEAIRSGLEQGLLASSDARGLLEHVLTHDLDPAAATRLRAILHPPSTTPAATLSRPVATAPPQAGSPPAASPSVDASPGGQSSQGSTWERLKLPPPPPPPPPLRRPETKPECDSTVIPAKDPEVNQAPSGSETQPAATESQPSRQLASAAARNDTTDAPSPQSPIVPPLALPPEAAAEPDSTSLEIDLAAPRMPAPDPAVPVPEVPSPSEQDVSPSSFSAERSHQSRDDDTAGSDWPQGDELAVDPTDLALLHEHWSESSDRNHRWITQTDRLANADPCLRAQLLNDWIQRTHQDETWIEDILNAPLTTPRHSDIAAKSVRITLPSPVPEASSEAMSMTPPSGATSESIGQSVQQEQTVIVDSTVNDTAVAEAMDHNDAAEADADADADAELLLLLLNPKAVSASDLTSQVLVELASQLLRSGVTDQHHESATLLAGLLTFHVRERSAEVKAYTERLAMNPEALWKDSDCLSGAVLDNCTPYRNNRVLATYRYESMQPFRLAKQPDKPLDVTCQTTDSVLKVEAVDVQSGTIDLSLKAGEQQLLAPATNLIHCPQDISKHLRSALAEQAPEWLQSRHRLPAAFQHLVSRTGTASILQLAAEVKADPGSISEQISRYLFDADGISLVLQGPPGSGKTTCAADIILSLVASGFNIGVCANSHLAIDHLLKRTAMHARQADQRVGIVKFQSKASAEERQSFTDAGISLIDSRTFRPDHDVYGGTAFAFSQARFAGLLDLLIIDEASQVPMANLLAMSHCARNILLVGDQQQLSLPVMAEHPEESGLSCLAYATDGKDVIPSHKGLFLNTSWRLPTNLCSFVSDLFYQGHLSAHPANSVNTIHWDGRSSGLLFIPVEHQDNHIFSEKEAQVVLELVNRLLGSGFSIHGANHEESPALQWSDIAIMAPYNAQVNCLKRVLGPDARVGTVDRFQGQEAPVAIYSLTSSSALSPRGLEFVLNANRLNVAISRAQCLSIVVGSKSLSMLLADRPQLISEQQLFFRLLEHCDVRHSS